MPKLFGFAKIFSFALPSSVQFYYITPPRSNDVTCQSYDVQLSKNIMHDSK